jgi:hypothetical protein
MFYWCLNFAVIYILLNKTNTADPGGVGIGRLVTGIMVSNSARGMDVCLCVFVILCR